MPKFSLTQQGQHWIFSQQHLQDMRSHAHDQALERLKLNGIFHMVCMLIITGVPDTDCLTLQEEVMRCKAYFRKAIDICANFKLPTKVAACFLM